MASYACFCPGDHQMDHTSTYRPYSQCNQCKKYPYLTHSSYYECRKCDFDICEECYDSQKKMICAQGHQCQSYAPGAASDSHECFNCNKVPSQNQVEYFVCEKCPNNTCQTCALEIGMALAQGALGMFNDFMNPQ